MGDIFGKIFALCIYISPLFLIALLVLSVYTYISNRRNAKRAPPTPYQTQTYTIPRKQPVSFNVPFQGGTSSPYGIPSYAYDDVNIFASNTLNRSALLIGDKLVLQPEPTNEYDKKAVAIFHNGVQIGYMYRNTLQKMYHDFIRKGGTVTAEIAAVSPELHIKLQYYSFSANSRVYVSRNGKCYHSDPLCCTKDENNLVEISISEAVNKEFSPCSKCIK